MSVDSTPRTDLHTTQSVHVARQTNMQSTVGFYATHVQVKPKFIAAQRIAPAENVHHLALDDQKHTEQNAAVISVALK